MQIKLFQDMLIINFQLNDLSAKKYNKKAVSLWTQHRPPAMRGLVLALSLALVVPEFAASKTFVYKYEGLLLGGLPQEGLAKAGIKVSSKVLISAVAQNTFLLKLEDPQILEYAGIWPQDPFIPAAKLTSALTAQLEIPIKFEYANGVVGKVFAPAGVSATVLNLQRGILNVLQLNLKQTQNVYELHEAGTHGVCKTHYMISEDEKTHQIVVKKSKDLTNCHERTIKDIGLAYTETCVECQKRVKSLTGTAAFSYIMKPTDSGAVVSEATVEEVHRFSAFNTFTGAAQMKAKQTLTLLEVQNKPTALPSAEYMMRGSLRYEFSTEILQTPIQLLKINNPQTQIMEVLQHLVTNNMAIVHEDAPLKFVQLVQLMRVATLDNIEAVWTQHKTKPIYRRWILDALPVVGTSVGLKFIKEKFEADELTFPEASQTLLVALHMATAHQDAIHLTANLAQSPKVKTIPVLREMIMLGYGSMIARHCAEVPNCSADHMRPIHEIAADAISKTDIAEITLALKVLGNAGHPASLKPIMKLLPGFGSAAAALPLKVQVDAILALRNIAKREQKLVQPVALQLFMDKNLHPELRMVACIVLFETRPSVALLSTVADALQNEPNIHVVSFTYSHLKSLTRSMAPDFMHVAASANAAIRMLSPKLDRLSYFFSKAVHLDLYISPFMVGAAGSAFMINDAATILPRAILTKARVYLAGAAADVLEVGVRTEGLQEALQKSNAAENVDRITKIKRTLKVLMDWKSLPNNQPLASVFVKVLGQEIAFVNIDKNLIKNIIMEQAVQAATGPRAHELLKEAVKALQAGIALQYAKPLMAAEVRRILPTCVGVPMELGYYTAAVAAAALNIQATITPALPEHPETISLDQLMKTDFQVQAEAKPSVSMQTFAVIGVNTHLIQAAVMARGQIHTAVPAKVAVRANLPQGHFKVEVLPAAVPDHVAAVRFETVAVARNVEELPTERIVSLAPPVSSDAAQQIIPASIQKSWCGVIPYIQIKGCLQLDSRNAGFMGLNPLYYVVGQHSAQISVARGDGPSLERLELEVNVGSKAAESLIKEINLVDTETPEESAIVMKLKEILESGLRKNNSSSASSSSSISSSSRNASNSSSSSSSSSRSSKNSSSSSSSSRKNSRNSSSRSTSNSKNPSNSRSASSSRSSSSAHRSKENKTYGVFQKFHKDQYLAPQGTSKTSSSSSIETIQRKAKFLGDTLPPVFAIIARVVRSDRKLGYQLATYLDKSTSRIQIVLASIAEKDKWKMYADAVMPSKHKVNAKFAINAEGQEYFTIVKAGTGIYESNPAARFGLVWDRLPRVMEIVTRYAKRASEYISQIAPLAGVDVDRAGNSDRAIELIMALPSQNSMNIIMKIPMMTLSKLGIRLPVDLPIERDGTIPALQDVDIRAILEQWYNDIRNRIQER